MAEQLPSDVKAFIDKHIHSVAQLEILLMLQSEPERTWTAEEVTRHLYLQPQMTSQLLLEIVERGLANLTESGFRFRPASEADRLVIELLAEVYPQRRVAVISEIFSKPTDYLKAFSDAFRLRKED
jgi:DNA-binding IclR family transcriptional regulator